ncbi:MAG TPA: hypothetical protein VFI25_17900 [Planctomycetota bacterium]|jgi:hypothetical protein|nr:hypothetical protein [Planctomycetota bacterium]
MAGGRGAPSVQKRLRELKKQRKRQEKIARKKERKAQKEAVRTAPPPPALDPSGQPIPAEVDGTPSEGEGPPGVAG